MSGLSALANTAQQWKGASQSVVAAVQGASARTGVSFDYLMDKAKQESSFNPAAKAKTSSASGLFQFIESTWLQAVKSYGDQFGLGDVAAKISTDGGKARVADAATKAEILKLRENPEVASNIVAAMTKDNANYLESSLGTKVGETDLYMAHFLGLGGADKFLKAKQKNPMAKAADLFPAAAGANKNVFYNANGSKRSLDEVYAFFSKKMDDHGTPPVTGTVTAQAAATPLSYRPSLPESTAGLSPVDRVQARLASLGAVQRGERQMIETLLSGMDDFGSKDKENRIGGNLLSPYTAFVLSKLNTPDEKPASEQEHNFLT